MQYSPNFGTIFADISLSARHIRNFKPDYYSTKKKMTPIPIFRFFQYPPIIYALCRDGLLKNNPYTKTSAK